MTSSSVTIRVDSDTKEAASRNGWHFGSDLSSVTLAFCKQMVRESRIPPNPSDSEPNAESLEAIREADELIAAGGPGYESAKDMFKSMGL